jgi:hypothetical protein
MKLMLAGVVAAAVCVLVGCASEQPAKLEVLKPSELNARWKDFDRKPVEVHGWVQQTGREACIYDTEEDARSDDPSVRDRRVTLINVPESSAKSLFGKVDTIRGIFRWDIESRNLNFGLCHYSGVEFQGAS